MNKHTPFTPHGFKFAVLALAICGAGAALADSTTATSTSTVVKPIAIAKAVDLSFGNFAGGGSAGTVTLSPDGTRALSGGALPVGTQGGTITAAKFDVTGQDGYTYSISVSGTALTSGANSMAFTPISDVTASSITTGNATVGTLTGGAQSIYVGGILTVGANQAVGDYAGTVTATVDYN